MNDEDAAILRSVSHDHGLDAAAVLRMLLREERRRLNALLARPGAEGPDKRLDGNGGEP